MKVVVTGNGHSGSWCIRGAQLGRAIGAEVAPHAKRFDGADIVIAVKRAPKYLVPKSAKLVWDVVDAWPQPNGVNHWERRQCLKWLREQIAAIKPHAIVAATQVMATDLREVFDGPILALPHHARPNQVPNPISWQIREVGFEGGMQYLGHWTEDISRECQRRGWHFTLNPTRLAHVDVVVAVRACQAYASRSYKSNVKLANAQGSGTPFIGNREAGYLETVSGAEHFADDMVEMRHAFDALTDVKARREASDQLLAGTITLDDMADTYRKWLKSLL